MLKLYTAQVCPFAHRCRLALALGHLEHERVEIDLADMPDWYRHISPNQKVPLLEHNGHRIWESAIINEYLADVFSDRGLLPHDPLLRVKFRLAVDWAGNHLIPTFTKSCATSRPRPLKRCTKPSPICPSGCPWKDPSGWGKSPRWPMRPSIPGSSAGWCWNTTVISKPTGPPESRPGYRLCGSIRWSSKKPAIPSSMSPFTPVTPLRPRSKANGRPGRPVTRDSAGARSARVPSAPSVAPKEKRPADSVPPDTPGPPVGRPVRG